MLEKRLTIRKSKRGDLAGIAALHSGAFGREAEAALALALISGKPFTLSFVAECAGRIAGHVLLSRIEAPVRAMALAPLAVAAPYREMQVGTALVRSAIKAARKAGYEAIFVLGDNSYYERFGFSAPKADPFETGWRGPHFMALELVDGALKGKSGKLVYPPEFQGADY